jgi:YVTN family beta-propeller protein
MIKRHLARQKRRAKFRMILFVLFVMAASSISIASESVYVVNSFGRHSPSPHWSTVDQLNGDNLSIIKTLTVGYDAHNLAPTPDGAQIWVTARGSNNISVIDTASFKIIKDITGDFIATPLSIAFTPDGTRAYVAFESIGQVGVFDAKTYAHISSISLSGHPSYLVMTPNGKKVYAVDYLNAKVLDIRTSDNVVVASIPFRGHKLQDAVASADGSSIYVCNQDKNQIEVITTQDDSVLVPIPTAEIYPRGIGISPDGAYLFIGLNSGVQGIVNMLRLSDDSVVSSQRIGGTPRTIAVRPDGKRIYVADYDNDKCYAFDVIGENMTSAASVNLNTFQGARAAPIGLAIVDIQTEGFKAANKEGSQINNVTANASEVSLGSPSAKEGKPSPGFGNILAIVVLVLLSKFMRHER